MAVPKKIFFHGLKRYITTRNVLFSALVFMIYLMFSDLAKAVLFMAVFLPLGILSIKVTRIIPHATLDLLAPCTFFIAYLYGWPAGLFFGVILGAYMWSTAYPLSQFVLLNLFLYAVTAFLAHLLAAYSWKFATAYFIGVGIKNILYFGIGALMGNPLENTIHTISSSFTNMVICPPFLLFLYWLATNVI